MDNSRSYLLTYGILALIIIALIAFLIWGAKRAQAPGSQNIATGTPR